MLQISSTSSRKTRIRIDPLFFIIFLEQFFRHDARSKLTALLDELTTETSKMQTHQDPINALLNESVMIPPELIAQTQNFIEEHKQMGYTTKEEFVRDAIRFRLTWLKGDNECLEIRVTSTKNSMKP